MGKHSKDETRPIIVRLLNYKHKTAVLMKNVN